MTTYSLLPFNADIGTSGDHPLSLTVQVSVEFTPTALALTYELTGDIDAIEFSDMNPSPQRRDELWQRTCFECFIAPRHGTQYWEFNLSPSRDWNCYRFEDYRAGMTPERAWLTSPFQIDRQLVEPRRYLLNCQMDLSHLLPQPVPLQLGVTMVIATKDGSLSYWALSHPAANADFHQRQSWLIALSPTPT